MITAQEILEKSEYKRRVYGRFGCFFINIKLRFIETGEIVTATAVDIHGKYPNTVNTEELGHWYLAESFEFIE